MRSNLLGPATVYASAQRKLGLPVFVLAAALASGCDTTKTDNRRSNFPAPKIGVNNSIADVRIGEKVNGATCVTEVVGVFVFPLTKTSTTAVDESGLSKAEKDAKEGAIYKALFEGPSPGFNDDIIVNPVFAMKVTNYGVYRSVCATVVGYRGVVKGFKEAPSVSGLPDPKVVKTTVSKGKDGTTIETNKPDQNIQINVQ